MDTNFIKWMVGYAEGFKLKTENGADFSIWIPLKNTFLESWCNHFRVDTWKDIYYPLLLQRAIEGINKELDALTQIDMHYDEDFGYMYIYKKLGSRWEKTIDQAKEKALKYIYEEVING